MTIFLLISAGEVKEKSNSTLVIVIVILVVVLLIIIVLFLVFLYRGKRQLPCRKTRYGRKNWRPRSNGNQNNPEDNQLLKNLSKNPIYEVSLKNGNYETGALYDEVPGDLGWLFFVILSAFLLCYSITFIDFTFYSQNKFRFNLYHCAYNSLFCLFLCNLVIFYIL